MLRLLAAAALGYYIGKRGFDASQRELEAMLTSNKELLNSLSGQGVING